MSQKRHDRTILQEDLNNVKQWADNWLLKLNINKCKTISYGGKISENHTYYIQENETKHELEKVEYMKDSGVTFDSQFKFDRQIYEKINKAYSVLGLIK